MPLNVCGRIVGHYERRKNQYLCVAGETISNKALVIIGNDGVCYIKWLIPICASANIVVHMNCSFKVSCIFLPPVNE
jgi:hypothetical protein